MDIAFFKYLFGWLKLLCRSAIMEFPIEATSAAGEQTLWLFNLYAFFFSERFDIKHTMPVWVES